MLQKSRLVFVCSILALGYQAHFARGENTKHALQVVRLKPGDHKFVEVTLPYGEFRPAGASGRSDFEAYLFPKTQDGEFLRIQQDKPKAGEHFKAAPYAIAPGVTLRWSQDQRGIEFAASQAAKPAQHDVRIGYENFGVSGIHTAGFRVIILAE